MIDRREVGIAVPFSAAAQVGPTLLSLTGTLVLAIVLLPAAFGAFALLTTLITLSSTVAHLNCQPAVVRWMRLGRREDSGVSVLLFKMKRVILASSIAAATMAFVGVLVLDSWISPYMDTFAVAPVVALGVVPWGFVQLLSAELISGLEFRKLATISLVSAGSWLAAGVGLALLFGILGALVGMAISGWVRIGLAWWVVSSIRGTPMRRRGSSKARSGSLVVGSNVSLLGQLAPLSASAIVYQGTNFLAAILITALLSIEVTGFVRIALGLYGLALLFPGSLNTALLPFLVDVNSHGVGGAKVENQILGIASFVSHPLIFGAVVLASPMLLLFLGPPYETAALLSSLLLGTLVVVTPVTIIASGLQSKGRMVSVLKMDVSRALAHLGLLPFLLVFLGPLGVPFSYLLSYVVALVAGSVLLFGQRTPYGTFVLDIATGVSLILLLIWAESYGFSGALSVIPIVCLLGWLAVVLLVRGRSFRNSWRIAIQTVRAVLQGTEKSGVCV